MPDSIPSNAGRYMDEIDAGRFWPRVNFRGGTAYADDPLATAQGECWTWTGDHDENGYSRFRIYGRVRPAHRISFMDLGNNLPDNLKVDHLCRNHGCINPAHLEAVTQAVNVQRGILGNISECPKGHPYDEANTRYQTRADKRVTRYCRICLKASKARTYRRSLARTQ